MNREEVIRMAREAGFNVSEYTGGKLAGKLSIFDYAAVDIFIEVERALNAAYEAGAAAEREACAKVCEEIGPKGVSFDLITQVFAGAIRARGNGG